MRMAKDEIWKSEAIARHYLSGVRAAIPLAAEQLDVLLRLVKKDRPAAGAFLDLGCGDGILGLAIADAYPRSVGVFADFSEPMLAQAAARVANSSRPHHVLRLDYAQPDWTSALPIPEFDVVVSGYSIHHQPDEMKRRIYRDIYRLLKPGGIFLNLEHVASASSWGESVNDDCFVDCLHGFERGSPSPRSHAEIAAAFRNRPDKEANILAPVETQCAWLREIGFDKVDCFFKVFELALFGGLKPSGALTPGSQAASAP